MQHSCQISTPCQYVNKLLDEAGYLTDLAGKRVLENSFGEGNVLVEIVRRYILDCKNKGFTLEEIQQGLTKDITGYEIDQSCVNICIQKLNRILRMEQLPNVKWNIKTVDYLSSSQEKFDYIIGNPPYITYHNLTDIERKNLKQNFISCKKGRFDYYYAFLEKSFDSLENGGVLTYLVPFSLFRNKFAASIRSIIKNDIISIIDYSGIKVFDNATTSSVIVTVQKGSKERTIAYTKVVSEQIINIPKSSLKDKWFFNDKIGEKRFGDYYSIQNGVATLYNEAFLIANYSEDADYIITNGFMIEKEILRPAVSARSCKRKQKQKKVILLPYKLNSTGYERFSEAEFKSTYPKAYCYLQQFKERLLQRKTSPGVQWFEYGRTQALQNIQDEKLIIPMVITSKVTTYLADSNSVPYAGYFIKQKADYSLQFAKELLESPSFYEYIKDKGTPTTKTSYRISVKEIEDFTF